MNAKTTYKTIGDLVAARPNAVRALQRHDIDWCCNPQSLDEACEMRGIDVDHVLAEMESDEAVEEHGEVSREATLPELVDRIVTEHHEPLYVELQRIEALARKVVHADADRHGEQVWAVLRTFEALREHLERHMSLEEEALFPWILSGPRADAALRWAPIHTEHASEGFLVKRLRKLTVDYVPPPDASATWIALFDALRRLDRSLAEHTRLEQLLFERIQREAELVGSAAT